MGKKLMGFGKPAIREGMIAEERKEAESKFITSLLLKIQDESDWMGGLSEYEIREIVDEVVDED